MTSNPGDMFGDLFGPNSPFNQTPAKKKPEKGPDGGWHAKIIDGQYYVPLAEVAQLLKANDVLPAVRKGIEKRVEDQKLKLQAESFKPTLFTEVETGLCSGQPNDRHPLCIVSTTPHDMHTVEVKRSE